VSPLGSACSSASSQSLPRTPSTDLWPPSASLHPLSSITLFSRFTSRPPFLNLASCITGQIAELADGGGPVRSSPVTKPCSSSFWRIQAQSLYISLASGNILTCLALNSAAP